MSRALPATGTDRRADRALGWVVVAACAAFLVVVRPGLGIAPLAAGYLLLLGTAAVATGALVGPPGVAAPLVSWPGALSRGVTRIRLARAGPLPPLVVLAAGLVAVAVARLAAAPAPPLRDDAAALSLNLLAAVSEEALFRGLLFALLLGLAAGRRGAAGLAVVGTAAAFAALHLPAYGLAALPVDFGAGLLLGWQRHASGGWTAPAATHAAANLLAVI